MSKFRGRKMRISIILLALTVCGFGLVSASCASDSEPAHQGQLATIQRGDLKIDVMGVGNLALSNKVDLAFEIDGTVEEVLVEEAQSVEEGQVLARLVISDWQDQLTALEDKVTTAERNVTTKERAVTDAERTVTSKERAVTTAERQVTQKELDLLQAQINLNNARLSLEQTEETSTDSLEIEAEELKVTIAEQRLVDAQVALEDAATIGIEDAQLAVEDAKARLEDARIAVDDAEKALEDAKEALEEARNTSPEVIAPFDGFITNVNVSGGGEVKKGTVAVTLADPNKFEADIPVGELDILQVKLGGTAEVQMDAVQGMTLAAEVTHISPTATISQGVVNYKVKVTLNSLEAVTQPQTAQPSEATAANVTGGEIPEQLREAIAEGRMTQEQVEAMMNQRLSGQAGQSMQSSAVPADFQLKEGMTVTVSIIVDERNNALLVPNSAITTQGRQTFVQVAAADGTFEQRTIQTGISDFQFTEVIEGLTEGEQVMVNNSTATTTPSNETQQRQGGAFIPGMGSLR
jgi:HlyD family secretion protein